MQCSLNGIVNQGDHCIHQDQHLFVHRLRSGQELGAMPLMNFLLNWSLPQDEDTKFAEIIYLSIYMKLVFSVSLAWADVSFPCTEGHLRWIHSVTLQPIWSRYLTWAGYVLPLQFVLVRALLECGIRLYTGYKMSQLDFKKNLAWY